MAEEFKKIVPVQEDEIDVPSYNLLRPNQQRFVHMYLSGKYKISEISDILSVSVSTIRNWLKNPQITTIIDEYQQVEMDLVQHNLKALTMKALNKMNELIDSPVDAVSLQAAKDILDRTGFKPGTKQDVKIEVYNYEQQIKEIMGDDLKLLEDVDYEVE